MASARAANSTCGAVTHKVLLLRSWEQKLGPKQLQLLGVDGGRIPAPQPLPQRAVQQTQVKLSPIMPLVRQPDYLRSFSGPLAVPVRIVVWNDSSGPRIWWPRIHQFWGRAGGPRQKPKFPPHCAPLCCRAFRRKLRIMMPYFSCGLLQWGTHPHPRRCSGSDTPWLRQAQAQV